MKNTFLLPFYFKKIGVCISTVSIPLGVLALFDIEITGSPSYSWIMNYTLLIVVNTISLLMIGMSKERNEDECIMQIRANSLLLALWVNSAVSLLIALTLYDFDYLRYMALNIFLFMVIYIVVFRVKIAIFNSQNQHNGE